MSFFSTSLLYNHYTELLFAYISPYRTFFLYCVNIFSTVSIVMILLLGTILCLFRLVRNWFHKRKKSIDESICIDTLSSILLPVEIIYLMKKALHIEGITITLIDMAQHNYLSIHKEIEKRFFFFEKYNYILIKQKNTLYIPLYIDISRILFSQTDYLRLTKENENLYRVIEKINKYCKKQGNLKEESWIQILQFVCGIIAMAGIPSRTFFCSDLIPMHYSGFFAIIAILVTVNSLPRILTTKGKHTWQKVLLLKDYLKKQRDTIVWQNNIAYIFAFSIFKRYSWGMQFFQYRNNKKFRNENMNCLDKVDIHCISELITFNKKIISLMPYYQRYFYKRSKYNRFFARFDHIK